MKKYTAPELEIMEFELEDVLTISKESADPGTGWYWYSIWYKVLNFPSRFGGRGLWETLILCNIQQAGATRLVFGFILFL